MSLESVSGGGVREQWADQTSVAPPPLCCVAPDSHLTVGGWVALWVMSAAGFGGSTDVILDDVCLIPDVWIQISDLSSRCVQPFFLPVWVATPEVSQRRPRSISFIYIYNQSSCQPLHAPVSCVSGLKEDPSSAQLCLRRPPRLHPGSKNRKFLSAVQVLKPLQANLWYWALWIKLTWQSPDICDIFNFIQAAAEEKIVETVWISTLTLIPTLLLCPLHPSTPRLSWNVTAALPPCDSSAPWQVDIWLLRHNPGLQLLIWSRRRPARSVPLWALSASRQDRHAHGQKTHSSNLWRARASLTVTETFNMEQRQWRAHYSRAERGRERCWWPHNLFKSIMCR